jgi:hypothetical protein
MHTLRLHSHIAVLDPDTGLGIVVLPRPVEGLGGWSFDDRKQPPGRLLQRWFGSDAEEYLTMVRQLASIGWELPRDHHGACSWFRAGSTACCGRTMISLTGVDVGITCWPLPQLIDAARRMHDAASHSCHVHSHA